MHKLIRQDEAEKAQGLVFAPEVAAFQADWLHLQVTEDRFEANVTEVSHAAPLRDLVVGVFTLLEHTPADKMGLNYYGHHLLPDQGWQRVEDSLATKAAWTRFVSKPSLRSITIEGAREDAPGARMQVKIEPSLQLSGGAWVSTNEHYECGPDGVRELMSLLASRWEGALAYAKQVVEKFTGKQ